jgi:ABC-type dipeptide/oligopeptide/nickel transport system permease subunit
MAERAAALDVAGEPEALVREDWRQVLRRLSRNRIAVLGLVMIAVMALMALAAPLLAPYDPIRANFALTLEPPAFTPDNLFGKDELGRDIFSRVVYGARLSLFIGLMAVAIGVVVGVPLGLLAGYYRDWADPPIRSLADILLAFPPFLLALGLVAVLGVGLGNVIIAVGVSLIPFYIRIVRGTVFALREQPFVDAARAIGSSDFRVMFVHILPNALPPIIVQSTLFMGITILYAAGLGFLGLGVQAPTPEWGSMLGSGRTYLFNAPHIVVAPGLAIFFAVLGFNFLGDGFRDVLDPRTRMSNQ